MQVSHIDVSTLKKTDYVLNQSEWLFVVKSQDQLERRRRMLASTKGGKIGRVNERPTAVGLLARVRLSHSTAEVIWQSEFREPRHIVKHPNGGYLITEISCVKWLEGGKVKKEYHHPFFAFLHTIDLSLDGRKILVVSSGYDACFEIDIETGATTWEWFAWDNGFNPDGDGVWLASTIEKVKQYERSGKKAMLIDPEQFGEQGIVTSKRTAHPNVAVYDIYNPGYIIICIAHDGKLYRVSLSGGSSECICSCLNQMPHGLRPYRDGWLITNTTKGEFWYFSSEWKPQERVSLKGLGNKVPGTENVEWVQQVVVAPGGELLCLDANRGLIAVDLDNNVCSVYCVDENWCVQDALLMENKG